MILETPDDVRYIIGTSIYNSIHFPGHVGPQCFCFNSYSVTKQGNYILHWRIHCVGQGLKTTRAWFVQCAHGYLNRKRAATGKACMPLFRAGARP